MSEPTEQKRAVVTRRAEPGFSASGRRARRASPRFYVCVGLLLTSAVSLQALAAWLGRYFTKRAVPLVKPLHLLDTQRLLPEYEPHVRQPEALSEELLESLGTRDYAQWRLVDLRRAREDPVSVAHVLATYYTGQPDMVPHVPDECIVASGASMRGVPATERVSVPGVGAPHDEVSLRVLEFDLPVRGGAGRVSGLEEQPRFAVLYFFVVNNRYRTTRNEVRLAQSNLFDRYAYYAKIEIRFTDYALSRAADRSASLEAAGALLRKLLPILLKDHIADWEALNSEQGASARAG